MSKRDRPDTAFSRKLEYKPAKATLWKPLTDFVENSILREIMKAKVKCNINKLRNLLRSDFCEQFDPFKDYFDNLPDNEDEPTTLRSLPIPLPPQNRIYELSVLKNDLWQWWLA